jgi:uncharacterized membrane protein YfcA
VSAAGISLVAALVAFGALTGVVAGILGVGGGLLMVPFLTLVLDVPQHAAEGTSLLVILPTAIAASIALHRRGIGDLPSGLALGALGALGAALGALVALTLPGHVLRIGFACLLALMGARLVREALTAPSPTR